VTARIEVTPTPARVDSHLGLVLEGLDPSAAVTLRADLVDDSGILWRSEAEFPAPAGGRLDCGRQAPLRGPYTGAQPEGLLFGMAPDQPQRARQHPLKTGLAPTSVRLQASQLGSTVARATFELQFVAPGVERVPVRDHGLVGTAFVPAGTGPLRAVLVFGGSNGGLSEETAALLASHGLLALALAYFDAPGLPDQLVEIPLEYFERALGWLTQHPRARDGRAAVVGRSRGGELALLLGATYPAVDAVVAYVPSGIVHAGIRRGGHTWHTDLPAWTREGRPVPFLAHTRSAAAEPGADREPIACTPEYAAHLADWTAVQRAAIAVERIDGPVLLLSGTADAMWPSSLFSELVVARLAQRGFRHPVRHLAFAGAGHRFPLPTLPGTVTESAHPSDGRLYQLGGSAHANAAAGRRAHRAMLDLLVGEDGRAPSPG